MPFKTTFIIDPEKLKNLKRIAVEKEVTATDLYIEGIDYILEKYKNFLPRK